MGQKLTDFILLRAMYNGDLSEAIFKKDENAIINEVFKKYLDDIYQGFVKLEEIDVDFLYSEHIAEIEELNENPKLQYMYL